MHPGYIAPLNADGANRDIGLSRLRVYRRWLRFGLFLVVEAGVAVTHREAPSQVEDRKPGDTDDGTDGRLADGHAYGDHGQAEQGPEHQPAAPARKAPCPPCGEVHGANNSAHHDELDVRYDLLRRLRAVRDAHVYHEHGVDHQVDAEGDQTSGQDARDPVEELVRNERQIDQLVRQVHHAGKGRGQQAPCKDSGPKTQLFHSTHLELGIRQYYLNPPQGVIDGGVGLDHERRRHSFCWMPDRPR